MDVMSGFGIVAKELFDYNRDMYKFDQMQRLERDLLRLEMQVKRFELFREDIRDLVELTVGKMEMYHLVGALFLEFCVAFYVEGKIETVEVPPFTIALYYLSVAGAFMFLVLAVWLSMHASISSHSFGVRLLTRYVRLPIPGAKQMGAMNARLADFENEGRGMFRVPMLQKAQNWDRDHASASEATASGGAAGAGGGAGDAGPARDAYGRAGRDHLGAGEQPFATTEAHLMKAVGRGLAGEHVTLFRKLQARWQCYDAYARVCMSLGATQILFSISCYMINVCMIEYRSPSACFVLVAVFQIAALCISFLDIAGVRKSVVLAVQAVGLSPCLLAVVLLSFAHIEMTEEGDWKGLDPLKSFPLSPLCFFLMVVWLECMIQIAGPSKDEATLPRRYRSVLFLDVFSDLTHDPTHAEDTVQEPTAEAAGEERRGAAAKMRGGKASLEQVTAADDACEVANQAIRLWETVPEAFDIGAQRQEAADLRSELRVWRQALIDEIKAQARKSKVKWPAEILEQDTKGYYDLGPEELAEDNFRGRLVGPLELDAAPGGRGVKYYWDADRKDMMAKQGRSQVLTLREVAKFVAEAQGEVRKVVGEDKAVRMMSSDDSDDDSGSEEENSCCTRSRRQEWNPEDGPYVPQRLPWKIMRFCTRALQVAWFFQGTMFTLQELGYFHIDYSRVERREESESSEASVEEPAAARRLIMDEPWRLEEVAVDWPFGGFFRAEGPLSCLGEEAGLEKLMISTPHAVHISSGDAAPEPPPLRLHQLSGSTPPGAVGICGSISEGSLDSCIFARPRRNSVEFQDSGGASIVLPIEGALGVKQKPWRLVAGTHTRCKEVQDMLIGGPDDDEVGQDAASISALLEGKIPAKPPTAEWCLLLAGWSGGRGIDMAAVPLVAGPGSLPLQGEAIVAAFDLPLKDIPGTTSSELVALHLKHKRLWALQADGELEAWQAVPPQRIGRWRSTWQQTADISGSPSLRASGLCESGADDAAVTAVRLFVIGCNATGAPLLVRATPNGLVKE